MSRFVSNITRKIYLSKEDGTPSEEWIEMREKLSVNEVIEIERAGIEGLEGGINTLIKSIKAWNLTDENGELVPVSGDAIKRLDMATIFEILEQVKKFTKKDDTLKKDVTVQPNSNGQ